MRERTFWYALGSVERDALRAIGRTAQVAAGTVLCHQGAIASAVTILLQAQGTDVGEGGNVLAKEVLDSSAGDESIVELFGAGDLVAEFAAWGHPQRGSISVLEEVSVLRIDRHRFAGLLSTNPVMTEAFLHTLAARNAYVGRRQAALTAGHCERLAVHLLELTERFGEAGEVPLRLSQAELACWAGVSRETLVRCFRRWRDRKIITHRARRLAVHDWPALRRQAGPWGDEWSPVSATRVVSSPMAAPVAAPVAAPGSVQAGKEVRLPPESGTFAGRRGEILRLDLLLGGEERPRVIVIEGMAGVGKTTLALHWVRRALDRFPGGAVFVDLRGRSSRTPVRAAEALGQVLRRLLCVPADQVPADVEEMVALYRYLLAHRRAVIVLDNAADAAQLSPLIPQTDSALLVVTTRQRLADRLGDERVAKMELGEMTTAEAIELFGSVLGRGDARLAQEPKALTQLAQRCGHLPLALRVVAARLAGDPAGTVAGVLRELASASQPSAVSLSDHPLSALGTTFDLAYRALPPETRAAFRALGLTSGPDFTAEPLAALLACDRADAERHLAALHSVFLVTAVSPGRYRAHDLLRDFARERALAEDPGSERSAAQRRLLSHYLHRARTEGSALVAGPASMRALAWFEAERRNLVAAVHQAARLGLRRTTWELADALYGFLELARYSRNNVEVHQAGLEAARKETDAPDAWSAAALMLHHLAVSHLELGSPVETIGYAEQALRGFRSLQDRPGEARVLGTLSDVHFLLGRYAAATDYAEQALAIHREFGDRLGEARALNMLGRCLQSVGCYDEALAHGRRALEIRRSEGDRRGAAETLLQLARVLRHRGAFQDALHYALESLDLRQDLGGEHAEALALIELATLYLAIGLRAEARADADRALEICRAIGARHDEADAQLISARLMSGEARHGEALTQCGAALRLNRAVGHRAGEADAIAQMGAVNWELGRYPQAKEYFYRSLEIRREIGDRQGEAYDLAYLSQIMRRLRRLQEAVVLGLEALDLWQQLGAKEGAAGTLGALARTYLLLGLVEEAESAILLSLRMREEIGDDYGRGAGLDTLSLVLRQTGQYERALEAIHESLQIVREVGDGQTEAIAVVHLAELHLDLDRLDEAAAVARQGLEIATARNDYRRQASALHALGRIAQRRQRDLEAVEHFTEEIKIRQETGDLHGQRAALVALRTCCLAIGDHRAAADHARRIETIGEWLAAEHP